MNNVAQLILADGRPEAPAVLCGRDSLSYDELRARVHGIAQLLSAKGLARGDRVGLLAENGPFFVAAYLGVIRAGLCVVPLQVDCGDQTLAELSQSMDIRTMLVSVRFAPRFEPLARRMAVDLLVESADLPRAISGEFDGPPIDPRRDLAAIMLTSGSTGRPKGVMVSHRNIECNTRDILQYTRIDASDRAMVVLPFYYCYGLSLLHTHLMAGAALVINNRFMFPEKVLDEMVERRCTGLAGVPSTFQILLRKTRFASRAFPDLRWLQQAGGKLPNPFIRELRRAFPQVKLFVMYGQTEATARLSYLPPELLDQVLGSVGRGLPSTRLEVLKSDGTPVQPGSEEVGEIVASGDNITLGYWKDPAETGRYFRDGRLYTGDLARVDAEGMIFVVERARDFIKSMGNRVSPKEIEDVIAEMPEVVEIAVIGVPDEIWGEAIKACIVTTQPGQLNLEAIHAHCLSRLPNFKIPQYVEFMRSLPKTANGKVAKGALREAAVSDQRSAVSKLNADD